MASRHIQETSWRKRILTEYLGGVEWSDSCDFKKPRKRAGRKERLSSTSKARKEAS